MGRSAGALELQSERERRLGDAEPLECGLLPRAHLAPRVLLRVRLRVRIRVGVGVGVRVGVRFGVRVRVRVGVSVLWRVVRSGARVLRRVHAVG